MTTLITAAKETTFYSATLLIYVPMFDRMMFGSFQLCSEV